MFSPPRIRVGTSASWSLACCAAAIALAACSTNAGFGPTPPNGPVPGQVSQTAVTPCLPGAPCPSASPSASATPVPLPSVDPQSTLSLDAFGVRLGYDARASDPLKADRYVVATFALKNASKIAAGASAARIIKDGKTVAEFPLGLTVAGERTSPVSVVALRVKGKPADARQFVLAIVGDKKQIAAAAAADAGGREYDATPLDAKKPITPVSLDGLEVSSASADGKGPFFELTFALINGTAEKVEVTGFTVTPPKSAPIKVALPLSLGARTMTGFFTFVLRHDGKTLPPGEYVIEANGAGAAPLAKATAALL